VSRDVMSLLNSDRCPTACVVLYVDECTTVLVDDVDAELLPKGGSWWKSLHTQLTLLEVRQQPQDCVAFYRSDGMSGVCFRDPNREGVYLFCCRLFCTHFE
jgi:hypothetical protein